MADDHAASTADDPARLDPGLTARRLRPAAAVLAAAVAAIHLFHPQLGAPRLVVYLRLGTLFDPRPLLFTVSAFLVVFGVLLVYHDLYVRAVYLSGAGLMLTYLLGYGVWHTALDHGAFWPHLPSQGHTDIGVLETVAVHLAADAVAAVSALLEFGLFVLLVALYRVES